VIVVVSCGKSKRTGRHPIGELYVGGYFINCRDWAESMVPGAWYIVSAKYGLRDQRDVVDSYDMTMKDPGAVTGPQLVAQAAALGIAGEQDVYLVGGELYLTKLREVWPSIEAPFGKSGGRLADARFGFQRKALIEYRGRLP
jgi:hypothetical protein